MKNRAAVTYPKHQIGGGDANATASSVSQAGLGATARLMPLRPTSSLRWSFLACLLLVACVVLAIPGAASAGVYGDLAYDDDGASVTITGCATEPCAATLDVPAEIDGLPVEWVGDLAFWDASNVTRVTLPEGLLGIGEYAFAGASSLTSINLPSTLTTIGSAAFENAESLQSVAIPEGVEQIDYLTFSGATSLASVTLTDGLIEIGDWAFDETASLKRLALPASLERIGSSAFVGSGLQEAVFAGDAPILGEDVFADTQTMISYPATAAGWSNPFAGRPARPYGGVVAVAPAESGTAAAQRPLVTGRARINADGTGIALRVAVPARGRLIQVGTSDRPARSAAPPFTVCRCSVRTRKTGRMQVSCPLTRAALRALRSGPLRVTLTTTLISRDKGYYRSTQTITLAASSAT